MLVDILYKIVSKEDENNKLLRVKNIVTRKIGTLFLPIIYKLTKNEYRYNDNDIIINLTTYGERTEGVWVTVESLMRQKECKSKIILWLSETEFSENNLPKSIVQLQNKGLEVRYCEDFRSYKKIYFAAKEFSDKILITVDDDCIYPSDFIKNLIIASKNNPQTVCCYRSKQIAFDNKKLLPYNSWVGGDKFSLKPRSDLIAIGCGGVLYPKYFFKEKDIETTDFYDVAPQTDDLWLKVLAMKNGYKIMQVVKNYKGWIAVKNTKNTALYISNVGENKNDYYLNKLLEYYDLDILDYM